MRKLSNVTLIAADCANYGGAINALQKSMAQCEFGAVKFLTDIPIQVDGIEVIEIPRINSKEEYSRFIVKELYKYIETDYVLIVQHDGYVLDGDCFNTELFHYDYAGALWLENDGFANGNSGFGWRSRRLCEIVALDETIKATHPEDAVLCRTYRPYLEAHYGLKWANDRLCEQFSYELREPNQRTFGFHGYFHKPYKETVVLKRSGALGDCVLMEPVVRWYCENGYNVVLDMPANFFELFLGYPYPVKHISNFDYGRITPKKVVNLDMAYEVFQDRPLMQSYFEMCGIKEYELKRPQLYPLVRPEMRLFRSYAVLHIDERDTPERNSNGVEWGVVVKYLQGIGIDVIQIGHGRHEEWGLWVNTTSVAMMKYVIAGASLFIGIDSGPSHIAVAQNIPSVLLFGSTRADLIHVDMENVKVVQGDCDKLGCWHVKGGTAGQKCVYAGSLYQYQCTRHETAKILTHINELLHGTPTTV